MEISAAEIEELKADAEVFRKLPPLRLSETDKPDTLFVVVDMVKGFTETGPLSSERGRALVPKIKETLLGLKNAEIALVRDCHTAESREFSAFPAHCVGEESELHPALAGIRGRDVPKNSTDGLTALLGSVNPADYKLFVITGLCADICVLQLALSLNAFLNELSLPGSVCVPASLTDTYDAPGHSAALNKLIACKLMAASGVAVCGEVE